MHNCRCKANTWKCLNCATLQAAFPNLYPATKTPLAAAELWNGFFCTEQELWSLYYGVKWPPPPAPPLYTAHSHKRPLLLAHDHVCWVTFNMPVHFPSAERQTGRLSDCQSAVITFTAARWSAALQTPGKLPQPLTFPFERNYVNGSHMGDAS